MRILKGVASAVMMLCITATMASAQPAGTQLSQPTMTFGGTGIPNGAVMVNSSGPVGVTLGITAHQRYSNPALTNNGAGTFYASPGVDINPPSSGTDPYATWNFGFYIGGQNAWDYTHELLYDFNPAVGNSGRGSIQLLPGEDSWNLGMNFLGTTVTPSITAPTYALFDPSVAGLYSFSLVTRNSNGGIEAQAGMDVNVRGVSTVPEPSTYALMAAGLAGLGLVARRRKMT